MIVLDFCFAQFYQFHDLSASLCIKIYISEQTMSLVDISLTTYGMYVVRLMFLSEVCMVVVFGIVGDLGGCYIFSWYVFKVRSFGQHLKL